MEMYNTSIWDMPTIVLAIGLAIMLIGGLLTCLIKDEEKMWHWLIGTEIVGGIINIIAVAMILII